MWVKSISVLCLISVCLFSCKRANNNDIPVDTNWVNKLNNDFEIAAVLKNQVWGCGTFAINSTTIDLKNYTNILEEWEDNHPGKVKTIYFTTSKKKAYRFIKLISAYPFNLSPYDLSAIENFNLAKQGEMIWWIPNDQYCLIKNDDQNVVPIKISVSSDFKGKFAFEMASDSSTVNRLSKVITQNHLSLSETSY